MRSPWRDTRRRRAAWFGLIAAVLVLHALLGMRVLASVIGWNTAPQPRRIEVSLMKPIAPSAPPQAAGPAAAPAPAPRPARAVRAPRASSAPLPEAMPELAPAAEGAPSRRHSTVAWP